MGFGSNYTGNPTAVQSPDTAPAVNKAIVVYLPSDLDGATWANIYQALKDLADNGTFLQQIVGGTRSAKALVLDDAGGIAIVSGATSALLRSQASDGTARSLTDYLGFRTGPVLELYDSFMSAKGATTGAQSSQSWGGAAGWTMNCTANCRSGYYGSVAGGQLTNTWPTGAYVLELQAARTNTDNIFFWSPMFYNATDTGSTSHIINKCVTVVEWSFGIDTSTGNVDWYQGMTSDNSSSPISTAATLKAGLRYSPFLKSDTTIKLVTSDGTADNVVDTGIAPTFGTIYRCRLEVHRSGTPMGATVRAFVNGTLVTSASHLPIINPIGVDMDFEFYVNSTATPGVRGGLEVGYWKMFKQPLGALTAGALTSDV